MLVRKQEKKHDYKLDELISGSSSEARMLYEVIKEERKKFIKEAKSDDFTTEGQLDKVITHRYKGNA